MTTTLTPLEAKLERLADIRETLAEAPVSHGRDESHGYYTKPGHEDLADEAARLEAEIDDWPLDED